MPYKQEVVGSNPTAPTTSKMKDRTPTERWQRKETKHRAYVFEVLNTELAKLLDGPNNDEVLKNMAALQCAKFILREAENARIPDPSTQISRCYR